MRRLRVGRAADPGKAEVVLAMTTRDTSGAAAELTAMKEGERERQAEERVERYVAKNLLNPQNKPQMAAALALAHEARSIPRG